MSGRDNSIDLIKIIAMLGVISLHSTMKYIVPGTTGIADVIYDMGIISMPLFFMVSGYLMIPKQNICYKYVFHKILSIVRFVGIVVFFYWALYSVVKGSFSILHYLNLFFGAFLQYDNFSVFWYFGAIIICYMLLPIISSVWSNNRKMYLSVVVVLFVINCFAFSCSLTGGGKFEMFIPATFRFWYNMFYFMIGGCLVTIKERPSKMMVFLLFIITIVYKEFFDKFMGSEYASLFYSSPIVMLLVICLFLFIRGTIIKQSELVRTLSQTFLPVYALHIFVISYMPNYFERLYIAPFLTWLFVSIITISISIILMKIPIIKDIFKI